MKAYQAYGTGNSKVTSQTARAAAKEYFARYPSKRKCDVVEGESSGGFFTVKYGSRSQGKWPTMWKDVTPKTMNALPDEKPVNEVEVDKLATMGVAIITDLGSENIYFEVAGTLYFSKVYNTEDYQLGPWDFAKYPKGNPKTATGEHEWNN